MNEDRCLYCGEIIPEGRMTCPLCEKKLGEGMMFLKREELQEILSEVRGSAYEYDPFAYVEMKNKREKEKIMRIKLDEGAYPPVRAHDTDAGMDIRAKDTQIVSAKESAIFHTGVHIKLPKGTAGLLVSKSGLNIKHDITSTGLIDESYSGEIVVKLINHGGYDYKVEAGEKISQLVIVPVLYEDIEIVDDLMMEGGRGDNGFGSTGRF